MKIKFTMREKLYSDVYFEVECDSEEELEEALDRIGEYRSADDIEFKLKEIFGIENVKSDGINDAESIYQADECEFLGWED